MDAVTVSADRRRAVPPRQRLAVHAVVILAGDGGVALAACPAHVELENAGQRIVGRTHVVRVVEIGADRGPRRAFGDGFSVHAFLIGDGRLRAQPRLLHDELLAVTARADLRDFGPLHRLDLMRGAVAVLALRPFASACCRRFRMQAVIPGLDRVGMARPAVDFLRCRIVRNVLDVRMAACAVERCVNGCAELFRVHGVVTRETFVGGGLRRCRNGGGQGEEGGNQKGAHSKASQPQ